MGTSELQPYWDFLICSYYANIKNTKTMACYVFLDTFVRILSCLSLKTNESNKRNTNHQTAVIWEEFHSIAVDRRKPTRTKRQSKWLAGSRFQNCFDLHLRECKMQVIYMFVTTAHCHTNCPLLAQQFVMQFVTPSYSSAALFDVIAICHCMRLIAHGNLILGECWHSSL